MTSLEGVRVLIVEDEAAIALMIEDMFLDMGCVVVGSAGSVSEAMECVKAGGFDFVLLDFNLGGKTAEAVAEALISGSTPFVFASGYGRAGLPVHLQGRPVIQKPFTGGNLKMVLQATMLADRLPKQLD